jgi:hypothetical protein
MRTVIALAAAALVTGCAAYYPSAVDERFGAALMAARASQVADPAAAARARAVPTLDGMAADSAVERYQKSFDLPPPPTNVFNIGIGTSGGVAGAR